MYLAKSTLFQSNTTRDTKYIDTSESFAATQTALGLSGDKAKRYVNTASLWFDIRSGTSTILLGAATVGW